MTVMLGVVSRIEGQPAAAKIRGKAFECISLLGYAVGKEKFSAAAPQAMSAMMATAAGEDPDQTACIRGAMERICKIMGSDFASFLPPLLPGLLSSINLQECATITADEDDDQDNIIISRDENSFYKVNTTKMQEILETVNFLAVIIKEVGHAFLEHVQPTAEALGRILICSDPALQIASCVRDSIYPCWAELVDMVTKSVPTRGHETQALAVKLVQTLVDKVGGDLAKADDITDIAPMASGLASVVRNAGAGCLQPAQTQVVCDLALSEINKSFQREKALEDTEAQLAQGNAGVGVDDEDDDSDLGDAFCMKENPTVFVEHSWPKLQQMLQQWLAPDAGIGRPVGLHIASEICEHLGENAVSVWPVFMDQVLMSVCTEDPDMRNTAAFTVMLAAQVPAFGAQYGTTAYSKVTESLKKFKAKKNDEDTQRATDNTVAALVQLLLSHPSLCSDADACWEAAFSRLPFKVDCEEGQKLHRKLFLQAQNLSGGGLGSPKRVAQVLGYLCEIYGRSEHCDDDLQREMAKAFSSLPQDTAASLLSQFSAKQQKKAQRIIEDGR